MGRLIFDISDEERLALEAYRVRFGLRSLAEALRRLVSHAMDDAPSPHASFRDNVRAARTVADVEEAIRLMPAPSTVQVGQARAAPGARLKKR